MSSDRNHAQNASRFVPRVEGLEDRSVPAGNVLAFVSGNVLYVTGDDSANQIWIAGAGKNSVVIRSLDGTTTINGQSAAYIGGIKSGYHVTMGGGDDVLLVTGTRSNGGLNVNLGEGTNYLGISDAGHRGETVLTGGNGDDTIILHASTFRRPVYVNTGAGDDQVVAAGIAAGDLVMANPLGTDYFDNQGSSLGRTTMTGFLAGLRPAAVPDVVSPVVPPAAPEPTTPVATVSTFSPAVTRTAAVPFTVTFSEEVTGFTADGLVVTNGTVTAFGAVNGSTYTFSIIPAAQGAVSVSVAAGAARNASGNVNAASNTVSVTFDSLAPAVTINALTTNSATPTITGTVDDPAAHVQVTVNGQTYTAVVSGTTWTAVVTAALPEGTYTVTATVTDTAGNTSSASLTDGLVVDLTAPTFTVSPLPPTAPGTTPFTVTITFDEDVTGFDGSAISVTNGTASNFQTVTAGRVFTIDVTPDLTGDLTLSVAAGAAQDAAGNLSAAADFVYDVSGPVATITATEPDPTNAATIHVTVTFDKDVTGFELIDLNAATTNGTASNLQSIDARTYTFEIVPTADGPVTFTLAAGAVTGANGNGNALVTFTIVSDTTAPTVSFSSNQPDPTNAGQVVVTVDFGEGVTGLTDAGITVGNGTFVLAAIDAQHYTITITPTADGPVTVDVAAGAATDAAGNPSAAGSFSFVYDGTAPTVTIDASATGAVTGSASDATTSVQGVAVSVFDPVAEKYLNAAGDAFDSDTEVWHDATSGDGFLTWSVAVPVAGTYDVVAIGTDAAGNSSAPVDDSVTVL